ncbi:unnamed protein product [Lepidochelys kempii]
MPGRLQPVTSAAGKEVRQRRPPQLGNVCTGQGQVCGKPGAFDPGALHSPAGPLLRLLRTRPELLLAHALPSGFPSRSQTAGPAPLRLSRWCQEQRVSPDLLAGWLGLSGGTSQLCSPKQTPLQASSFGEPAPGPQLACRSLFGALKFPQSVL